MVVGGGWRSRERGIEKAISTAIQSTDRVVSPDAVTGHLRYWFHFHSSRIVYPTTTSLSIQYTDKYIITYPIKTETYPEYRDGGGQRVGNPIDRR